MIDLSKENTVIRHFMNAAIEKCRESGLHIGDTVRFQGSIYQITECRPRVAYERYMKEPELIILLKGLKWLRSGEWSTHEHNLSERDCTPCLNPEGERK